MTSASTISAENQSASSAFSPADRFTGTVAAMRNRAQSATFPWTFAMILVGLATVAICVLVPLREENQRLRHELAGVAVEADYVAKQVEANAAFLDRVHTDPALAERLVMRATRRPAEGKQFLDAPPTETFGASPYAITRLTPPTPPVAYQSDLPPVVGSLLVDIRSRVILLACGLFLAATGVILGSRRKPETQSA